MSQKAFEERKKEAVQLIQRIHAGQTRTKGAVPAWHHLVHVSRLLELVLSESHEGSLEDRETIILAALGHDALEDTEVTREVLKEYFGPYGVRLIEGVTNSFGDDHPEPYVRQVVDAEEGVRLIKLADLYDNCTSVQYTLFVHGTEWTEGYFLPIVQPMIGALLPTTFRIYPFAAGQLKELVRVSLAMLMEEIDRYREIEKP